METLYSRMPSIRGSLDRTGHEMDAGKSECPLVHIVNDSKSSPHFCVLRFRGHNTHGHHEKDPLYVDGACVAPNRKSYLSRRLKLTRTIPVIRRMAEIDRRPIYTCSGNATTSAR